MSPVKGAAESESKVTALVYVLFSLAYTDISWIVLTTLTHVRELDLLSTQRNGLMCCLLDRVCTSVSTVS